MHLFLLTLKPIYFLRLNVTSYFGDPSKFKKNEKIRDNVPIRLAELEIVAAPGHGVPSRFRGKQ